MDVRLCVYVVCCVGSGLCDGLITCLDEFYRVCVSNYIYVETQKMGQARPDLGRCATEKMYKHVPYIDTIGSENFKELLPEIQCLTNLTQNSARPRVLTGRHYLLSHRKSPT